MKNQIKEQSGEIIPNEKENGSPHRANDEKSHSQEGNLHHQVSHDDGTGQPANSRARAHGRPDEERASRQSLGSENQHPEPVPGDIESGDAILEEHSKRAPNVKNAFSLDELSSSNQSVECDPGSATPATAGSFEVSKPSSDKFVRTSTDPEHWRVFDTIEMDDQIYLVTPRAVRQIHLLHQREGQMVISLKKARFVLTVDEYGHSFLWRIGDPASEYSWIKSATNAATYAKELWVRLISNSKSNRYDLVKSERVQEPVFPPESYEELLNLAFEGKIIDSMDHEVIKSLLG